MDKMERFLLAFIISVAVACFAGLLHQAWFTSTHTCVTSHIEHHDAYDDTTYYTDPNGFQQPVPLHHAAYDEEVCDQWVEKKR